MTLAQVAEATGGRILGAPSVGVASVSTDSRSAVEGSLFVALVGDRLDGHAYVSEALGRGVAAVLVSDESAVPSRPARGAAVVVPDTLVALQDLAGWHRRRMRPTVVGLTGSVGKTTTKDLAAAILSRVAPTLKTRGNLNNHIGVPLTLLGLEPSHRFAIVEMGCNHFGEIARLAAIAQPSVGLITSVGEAHLEGLGDLDGVARAKGELFEALPRDGTAVVEIEIADAGAIAPTLSLLGAHNAMNALAAAALATALGVDPCTIEVGLGEARAAPGRLELRRGVAGLIVIDDSYNANPSSMRAALTVVTEHVRDRGARAHALLGEMRELGPESPAQHEGVGRFAAGVGLQTLLSTGAAAREYAKGAAEAGMPPDRLLSVETPEDAAAQLLEHASAGDVVLVKGSRAAGMDRAVAVLCDGAEEGGREGAP